MSTELKEEDMHYLGGLIDGDGSLSCEIRLTDTAYMGYTSNWGLGVSQYIPNFSASVDVNYDGEYDMHYIGGLMDSDGCIFAGVEHNKKSVLGYYGTIIVHVHMADPKRDNPTEDTVEQFFKSTGSDAGRSVTKREEGVRQDSWSRTVSGQYAVRALEMLRPYLRLKQPHADYIIEMAEYDTTTVEGLLKFAHAVEGYLELKVNHPDDREHNYEKLVDELWYNGNSAATGEPVDAEPPKSELPKKYGVDGDGEPDPESPEIDEPEAKTVNSAADW